MVRVVPFKAYRYSTSKITDPSVAVSPPYDVIKGKLVDKLHNLSQYNISHIIRGARKKGDNANNNEYTRASEYLEKWIAEGVLIPEDSEAFYVYGQEFEIHGKQHLRWGFIGLIELEDFGTPDSKRNEKFAGVLQHEETLPKDIQDRLDLLKATKANFGQIFVIYPDQEGVIDKILAKKMEEMPIMEVKDHLEVIHKLWVITDKADLENITKTMSTRFAIIADGHHRYKTALAYSKENPDFEAARFRMLTLVNMSNPGLVVLPTHRLVQHIDGLDLEQLIDKLETDFQVRKYGTGDNAKTEMFSDMDKDFSTGKHGFGIYANNGKFYSLTLKNESVMDNNLNRSSAWKKLDVTILHTLILEKYLGIGKEKLAQGTMEGGSFVEFIKGIGDAVEAAMKKVDAGSQAVFFMNPTRVEEVETVAGNFETMPQKSTFFYPKVYTGFTINKLD